MHPFCCISTVSDNSPTAKPLPDLPMAITARSDPTPRSSAATPNHIHLADHQHHLHHHATASIDSVISNGGRNSHRISTVANSASGREQPVDVKINDIVGNGISGILYKWVNYGKGWRPRWFVLQDGVLSYYKIHGPDKIVVNLETEKGCKVIGEESIRRVSKAENGTPNQQRRNPVGEVHLKVSTIRESRSDDKRFSIFTGTKRLHLRAETTEDRLAWMEALQAVKDMFPRISNSELMAPVDTVAVSTEKLRQRLEEEGVGEEVILESEQIMRSEFTALQNQMLLLKQKHWQLIEALRQLETEKVDLENTVIDESQRQNDQMTSSMATQDKFSEASASGSDDDNERVDAAEEETDDEENTFFDTRDFLSSGSFKSNGSDYRTSSFSSEDEGLRALEADEGLSYPYIKRRKKLPDPIEKEKGVSLWSMIKDNIGKDLTKVCLPVYFNEPLSSLQKCFEDLEYSNLIDRASEWGRKAPSVRKYASHGSFPCQGNSLMRILNVAAFAVSGYASTEGRICKPFNPLLGETYEADYPDKGLRFFSEKVSHHPMIVACHCEGTGWKFWGDSNLKSKFWGRSIQLDPEGLLTLEFDDGEVFQWSKVTTSIYNLILGKLYCDHYGTMRIEGNRDFSCKLKFKEQSIIDRNPHQIQGVVVDRSGKTVATLFGKWDESMHYVLGSGKGKGFESLEEAHTLWRRNSPPTIPTRYNLTRFAITLNELIPGLKVISHDSAPLYNFCWSPLPDKSKEKLPPTDSRLRPDQRYLENGEFEMANSEKLRLEQRQRQARKMQERGWKPRWFAKEDGSDTYRYIGGYWEAREKGKWDSCPDIFGQVPADQLLID
ncbi:unnamed protein product [Linum tenue]|uniref:PH domain-containing protein n=1 Tax=Linum tenue TaxID=586396 RepID=A0AAV0RVM7_9ROSI|nr:unnamed protein product [Linum tenue]